MRCIPLFCIGAFLVACLKEPEGGRVEVTKVDAGDLREDTGDLREDTGGSASPEEDFSHTGEYGSSGSISLFLSGGAWGDFQFCDQTAVSFIVRPNGVLTGQGSCTSNEIGADVGLAFSGEVTKSGSVTGEVAVQEFPNPYDMVGQISEGEIKVNWEGSVSNANLPFDHLEGEAWAFKD